MKATSSILGLLLVAGCASEPKSPTAELTLSVVVERVPVGTNLTVTSDIYRACRLHAVGERSAAPKFAFDESVMTRDDVIMLDRIASCLTAGPLAGRRVVLIGRTDPRGSQAYNYALGARRAHNVAMYLERHAVPAPALDEASRGDLDAKGHNERTFARDRRVDIALVK
jgi:outer membrane protein OmpA-like peptidoglycan-associated protein